MPRAVLFLFNVIETNVLRESSRSEFFTQPGPGPDVYPNHNLRVRSSKLHRARRRGSNWDCYVTGCAVDEYMISVGIYEISPVDDRLHSLRRKRMLRAGYGAAHMASPFACSTQGGRCDERFSQ